MPPLSVFPEIDFEPAAVEPLPCPTEAAWRAIPAPEPAAVLVAPRSPAAPVERLAWPALCLPAVRTDLASPRMANPHAFLPVPRPEPVTVEVRQFAAADRLPDAGAALRLPGLTAIHPVDDQPPQAGLAPLETACARRPASPSITAKPWSGPLPISIPGAALPTLPMAEPKAALPEGGFVRQPDSAAPAPGACIHPAVAAIRDTRRLAAPTLPPIEAVPAPEWGGRSMSDLAIEPGMAALPAATPECVPASPLPARAPAWNAECPAHPALPDADYVPLSYCLVHGPARRSALLEPLVSVARGPSAPLLRLSAEPASEIAAPAPEAISPCAGFIPLEYHSHRLPGAPISPAEWIAPDLEPALPGFALNPVLERLQAPTPRNRKPSSRAAVVAIPAPPKRRAPDTRWIRVAKTIAAGLLLGFMLWQGAATLQNGNGAAATQQDTAEPAGVETAAGRPPGGPEFTPARSFISDRQTSSKGLAGWLRNTFAKRASVQVVDRFRSGMEAWGTPAREWAPGWSRHADGYVRPGKLALFRPSLALRNYRLEFFAQIESKSLSWVVRARDPKNYYAMKFAVVEPGLRPVIAVVHYPVVGGKQGRKVEIPLSVMVHNNEPYRVAVDVKGNRVVTSIEGQEVDSWTDSQLASGGVGFFSDAGATARLYWMKISANDDLLGRVCGAVAEALGDPSPIRAQAWPREAPAGPSRPAAPAPPEGLAMAAGNVLAFSKRRVRSWEC